MITYIVVTNKNTWGKHESLDKALENARLHEETNTEFFAEGIQELEAYSMKTAVKVIHNDWDADRREPHVEIDIIIYRFDDEHWEDYEISSIDGGMSFLGFKGDPVDRQEAFKNSYARATWINGKIVPEK